MRAFIAAALAISALAMPSGSADGAFAGVGSGSGDSFFPGELCPFSASSTFSLAIAGAPDDTWVATLKGLPNPADFCLDNVCQISGGPDGWISRSCTNPGSLSVSPQPDGSYRVRFWQGLWWYTGSVELAGASL